MVAAIGTWVKALIVIVLLGNLAEFVLPKGDLRRYTGLVVGLILLLAMVSPVWNILHGTRPSLIQQQLMGTPSTQGLHQVIQQEEWDQAAAMVLTFPGVSGCTVRQRGPKVVVAVVVDPKVNHKDLRQYIAGALQVSLGRTVSVPAEIKISVLSTRTHAGNPNTRQKEG